MTADDLREKLLDKAAGDPVEAARLYLSEVARVVEAGSKAFASFVGQPFSPDGSERVREASRNAVPATDVAAVLFLGSFLLPEGTTDPATVNQLLEASFIDLTSGPLKRPARKLFVAWLERRKEDAALNTGLEAALLGGIPEAVHVARRVAADPKASGRVTGMAILVLGNHGGSEDLALLADRRDDTRPQFEYTTLNKERFEVQVREVAAAMSLLLRGQDFSKYGFEGRRLDSLVVGTGPGSIQSSRLVSNLGGTGRRTERRMGVARQATERRSQATPYEREVVHKQAEPIAAPDPARVQPSGDS